ncbi:MAG: hypothetical protein EKK29_19570 [Hyphomicrobiales bacterium]|nr:MAG: hypothetical protein EKK29_19570 [Hyphomicrobiales bacterium]
MIPAFSSRRRETLALLLGLILAAPASAGPRTIDDCEAIKDANAYNLCLASFGPTRGQHGASYPGVASEGEKGGEKASGGKRATGRHGSPRSAGASMSRAGGRVRMEFTPGRQ